MREILKLLSDMFGNLGHVFLTCRWLLSHSVAQLSSGHHRHDPLAQTWQKGVSVSPLYFLSVFYLIIVKLFRILKIVCRGQCPLVGEECGVTHQPQMLEPLLARWHDWNEVNKYRGSRTVALLRYQPVCLWYLYTGWNQGCFLSSLTGQCALSPAAEDFFIAGQKCLVTSVLFWILAVRSRLNMSNGRNMKAVYLPCPPSYRTHLFDPKLSIKSGVAYVEKIENKGFCFRDCFEIFWDIWARRIGRPNWFLQPENSWKTLQSGMNKGLTVQLWWG